MFENTPVNPAQPVASPTTSPAAGSAAWQRDQASIELYERAKLHRPQKVILLSITGFIVLGLIGAAIGVNYYLDNTSMTSNSASTTITPLVNTKDSDNDGLTDVDETQVYHTNPRSRDTDNDGYTDADELNNGYDPNGPGKL